MSSSIPLRSMPLVSTGSPFAPSCAFNSHRSPLLARHGAVCSSQPIASQIGLDLLRSGANAAEACIGIAAALNVLEPCSTGMGGDCFAIYFDAATGKVEGLNGSGRSPLALDQSKLAPRDVNRDGDGIHPLSIHAITVPGAPAGWCDALERWGGGKHTMGTLLAPAIALAREGAPISPLTAEAWQRSAQVLRHQNNESSTNPCVLLPNGASPAAGDLFRNEDLARSLELLARDGKDAFYRGPIGEALLKCVQQRGSLLTADDLAEHESTFPTPISVNYKGIDVWEIPPNGQGITALMALNILSALEEKAKATAASSSTSSRPPTPAAPSAPSAAPATSTPPLQPLASLGHNSGAYLHRVIESLRLAFADTRYYVCDGDHAHARGDDEGKTHRATIDGLLSMKYARERAERFDNTRTNLNHPYGSPALSSSTVSFICVDAAGNACSFINSNYTGFGSAIVVPGFGFTLQNRGANFTLDRAQKADNKDLDAAGLHPNRLAGRKRPYHTIIPALATKDGQLWAPFSVMGAFQQAQGQVQVFLNMVEFGMDPQAALDAARFCIESGHAHGEVLIEDGIHEKAIEELKARGHILERVVGYERMVFGRGQIIRRIPVTNSVTSSTGGASCFPSTLITASILQHVLWCGSDGRADGAPAGY